MLFMLEALVLLLSAYLDASSAVYEAGSHAYAMNSSTFIYASCFMVVMLFSMGIFGMYKHDYIAGWRNLLLYLFWRLIPSLLTGWLLLSALLYLIPFFETGTGVTGNAIVSAAILISLIRIILYKTYDFKLLKSRILILGCGSLARECNDLAQNHTGHHRYQVVGYVATSSELCELPAEKILPPTLSLKALAEQNRASEIIVCVNNRRDGNFPIQELLECKLSGIKVTDASAFFEREASQIRVDFLQPSWLVFGNGFDQGLLRTIVKRLFDLCASVFMLLTALPLMLITGILIYFEDGGPVFYTQERVGKDGHPFMVLKVRSMKKNAEDGMNPQWAAANDPRSTRVGRIIRKLRIDELPQLLNVFRGEMSFVGARPERPYFVNQLSREIPFYNMRHSIKPGITGLAQVRYQYGTSVDDSVQKLQYDLYYVKNNSLFLDALILIDTFLVVVLGKGQ